MDGGGRLDFLDGFAAAAPPRTPAPWSLPSGAYGVIYADPPWLFRVRSPKGTGRSPEAHYGCAPVESLARLPVADLAARDCVLLMWAIDPMLDAAFDLIRAWGFAYRTVGFHWVKENRGSRRPPRRPPASQFFTGLGYWTRANPELCLLATRGRPRRLARDVRRLVVSPRREHSRKPDEIHSRIERLCPGPYVELFARESWPGWDSWGDQAGLFDGGAVATRNRPSTLAASVSASASPTARLVPPVVA